MKVEWSATVLLVNADPAETRIDASTLVSTSCGQLGTGCELRCAVSGGWHGPESPFQGPMWPCDGSPAVSCLKLLPQVQRRSAGGVQARSLLGTLQLARLPGMTKAACAVCSCAHSASKAPSSATAVSNLSDPGDQVTSRCAILPTSLPPATLNAPTPFAAGHRSSSECGTLAVGCAGKYALTRDYDCWLRDNTTPFGCFLFML